MPSLAVLFSSIGTGDDLLLVSGKQGALNFTPLFHAKAAMDRLQRAVPKEQKRHFASRRLGLTRMERGSHLQEGQTVPASPMSRTGLVFSFSILVGPLLPQGSLALLASLVKSSSLFRARLLLHYSDIALKGPQSSRQPFDGKALEPLRSLKHVKKPIGSVDEQADLLLGPMTTKVVALVIDFDTAIVAHVSDKGLPMQTVEPAIWINEARQRW